MIKFNGELDRTKLVNLKPYHRAVQALICIVAYAKLGTAVSRIAAIRCLEGGVNILGKEIFINRQCLSDIDEQHKPETHIERAVYDALKEVFADLDKDNIQETAKAMVKKYGSPMQQLVDFAVNHGHGQPLSALFELKPEDDMPATPFGMSFSFHR